MVSVYIVMTNTDGSNTSLCSAQMLGSQRDVAALWGQNQPAGLSTSCQQPRRVADRLFRPTMTRFVPLGRVFDVILRTFTPPPLSLLLHK